MTSIGTATKPIATREDQPATTATTEKSDASPGSFDRILKGLKQPSARQHEPKHQPSANESHAPTETPDPDQPTVAAQAQIAEPAAPPSDEKAALDLAASLLLAATPLQTTPPALPLVPLTDAPPDATAAVPANATDRQTTGSDPKVADVPAVVTTANAIPSIPVPFVSAPVDSVPADAVTEKPGSEVASDTKKTEPVARRQTAGIPVPQVAQFSAENIAAPDVKPNNPARQKPDDAVQQIPLEQASTKASALVSVPEKSDGMSIALQSPMQEAPTQHAKPAGNSAQPIVPPVGLSSQPSASAQNESFDGNKNREKPADLEQAPAPVSAIPIFPAAPSVTTSRAPSITFAAGPEKTERVTAVVNHVLESADKMRSDGRTNAEVQVRLHDGNELTIQLRWNDGQLRPVFKTESLELRNAIEQNWSQFSTGASERGMKITNPVFEAPQSSMGDLNQRQNREQAQQQATPWSEIFSAPPQPKPRVVNPRAAEKSKEGLALYA